MNESPTKEQSLYRLQREFFQTWRKLYRQDFEQRITDLRKKLRDTEREQDRVLSVLILALKDKGVGLKKISQMAKVSIWHITFLYRMGKIPQQTVRDVKSNGYPKTLDDLFLPIRAFNALHNAGLNDVSFILKHTENQLLRYRNFGVQSLSHLKAALAEHGLKLREGYEGTPIERPAVTAQTDSLDPWGSAIIASNKRIP